MIRAAMSVLMVLTLVWVGLAQQGSSPPKLTPPQKDQKETSAQQGKNKLPELKLLDPDGQEDPKKVEKPKKEKVPDLKSLEPKEGLQKKDQKLKLPGLKGEDSSAKKEDPKEVMARIAKNMENVDTRLKKEDTGKNTREIQSKILEDLDKLIQQQQQQEENRKKQQQQERDKKKQQSECKNECKNPGESQSTKSKNQTGEKKTGPGSASLPGTGQGQGQGTKTQPQKQPGQKESGKEPKENKNGKGEKKQDQPQLTKEEKGKTGVSQVPSDKDKKEAAMAKKNTIAELYRDVWGHLPEKARMEMDAYSRSQFMPQYDQILRQYYRTIAEQGRRREKE